MKRIIALVLLFAFGAVGCTENQVARNFGGTMTMELPKGEKLINVTWKESQMWYLTRPFQPGEEAAVLTFQEKSDLGMMEGKVIFMEVK